MEMNDNAKANILKGVSRKLKIRGIKIAVISIIVCVLIGAIAYFLLFIKQTPISADRFKEVSIERKLATINQIDDRQLLYNHLNFTLDQNIWYSLLDKNMYLYVENSDKDDSASLYFYISESYMQKVKHKNMDSKMLKQLNQDMLTLDQNTLDQIDNAQVERLRQELSDKDRNRSFDFLLTTDLCQTNNGHINEVTKVYYLVYDYHHMNQEKFDKAKSNATLLWEK